MDATSSITLAISVVALGFAAWPHVSRRIRILGARRAAEAGAVGGASFRDLFDSAFEACPVGMAIVALDGRWIRVNRPLELILRRTSEELTAGLTFGDVTHPDDLGRDIELVRKLISGELARYTMLKRYILPDGGDVQIRLTAGMIRDECGEPACFMAHIEDVSGEAKRKLEKERDRVYFEEARAALQARIDALERSQAESVNAEIHAALTDLGEAVSDLRGAR